MDNKINKKITIDSIKDMNKNTHRSRRIYEKPIVEINNEYEDKKEQENLKQTTKKPKQEISVLKMILIHLLILFVIIIVFAIGEII